MKNPQKWGDEPIQPGGINWSFLAGWVAILGIGVASWWFVFRVFERTIKAALAP